MEERLQELGKLIADYRFLAAKDLYSSLKEESLEQSNDASVQFTTWVEVNAGILTTMLDRYEEVQEALRHGSMDEGEWLFGSRLFGVDTHYREEADNSITIKIEGEIDDLPIFEQCAVVHELDLFKLWLPFCTHSQLIEKVGLAELVGYLQFNIPPITRDCCIKAYAADCVLESSQIVIMGNSIDAWGGTGTGTAGGTGTGTGTALSFLPENWFTKRMFFKRFQIIFQLISPTQAKAKIVIQVDLQLQFLPQGFVNYVLKKTAGVFLYVFQVSV